jgi:dCMP deaminase
MKKKSPRITPDRDLKYMGLAFFVAGFSKDPDTQIGAVIVQSDKNWPLGYGYNGPPRKTDDDKINWSRPAKYSRMRHAEINAMDHSNGDLEGATVYVTAKPCNNCMLEMAAKGIAEICYFPHKSKDENSSFSKGDIFTETENIALENQVNLRTFNGNLNWMRDWMSHLEILGIFDNNNT